MTSFRLCSRPLGEPLLMQADTICFSSLAPNAPFQEGVQLEGVPLRGGYESVPEGLTTLSFVPTALIVLGVKGIGIESFLQALPAPLKSIPIAGGVVAREDLSGSGELHPACEDVLVIALTSGSWKSRTVTFHRPTGIQCNVRGDAKRRIEELETAEGIQETEPWFTQQAIDLGVPDPIWDRLAFLTEDGRLLHASKTTMGIDLGADLPSSGHLELAVFDER